MIKQALNLLISAVLAFVFLALSAFGDDLTRFLPEDGEIGTWRRQRPVQHFAGEDLYEYIDGGAEIYHEYGFKQVIVQDYVNAERKSLSVEIFEMMSPESAFGMYAFKTNARDEVVPLGNEGRLADYYLNFWKGPFLITLTGFDETGETVEGLLAIARAVDSKLVKVERGEKPTMAYLLPSENLEAGSLKYFKGLLGLRSSHPFFSLEIVGFEEGIKGDYTDGLSLFIIRFREEEECRKSFGRLYEKYVKLSGDEEHEDRGTFLAGDSRGRRFFISSLKSYLLIGMGDIDRSKAETILRTLEEKIKGTLHQEPPYYSFFCQTEFLVL
jgi:hypothetical protein